MKNLVVLAMVAGLALTSSGARAHFALQQPGDALVTDADGNPKGGAQKTSPCGTGTQPSGVVTKVKKGGKLHIKVMESVVHGGHYRVALSSNKADFKDPKTVVQGGDCKSAAIETTPAAPVLADGLFSHNDSDIDSGKVWETDVTVPSETCANCTLQVIQFMTPHAPGCFYYHCANIQIVDEDVADGGIEVGGPPATASSTSSSSSSGSRGPSVGDDDDDDRAATSAPTQSDGGCNVAGDGGTSSFVVLGLALALALASRRRRA